MGDWTITVHGTGAHHNKDYPNDADRLAEDFVKRLKDAGHTIRSASFTHGARQKLGVVLAAIAVIGVGAGLASAGAALAQMAPAAASAPSVTDQLIAQACADDGAALHWLLGALGSIAGASVLANFRNKLPSWLVSVFDFVALNFVKEIAASPHPAIAAASVPPVPPKA